MDEYIAFTTTCKGLANQLKNEVELVNGTEKIKVIAQWDTGATNSCISHAVVSKLNLVSTGFVNNQTPSGSSVQKAYVLDVILPNQLTVQGVVVSESEIGNQGIDILIGMDIIGLGDFAISNYNAKTIFTFRTPSVAETDYVKLYNSRIPVKSDKVYPNDSCPCGSGKKYKQCHGRL